MCIRDSINSIKEVKRVEGTFENYYSNQGLFIEQGIVIDFDEEVIEEYIENHDCDNAFN